MAKGKDFYGKDISEVIEQACKELGASRENLDIEVLETGSAGIFGLCKKKAHIRVQLKAVDSTEPVVAAVPAKVTTSAVTTSETKAAKAKPIEPEQPVSCEQEDKQPEKQDALVATVPSENQQEESAQTKKEKETSAPLQEVTEEAMLVPPTDEDLAAIQKDLSELLSLMGYPSDVHVQYEQNTVHCQVHGRYEQEIVGAEGRTLDSLQYLLRKMVSRHLPDRVMLSLNAGDFRERRADELKTRALELAELVKADGKTQAIPALNPSERRVVHMVLQEDKGVRSRSVGDGLFKKVLIYKPGKGRRTGSRKRRGGQGGRPSGE